MRILIVRNHCRTPRRSNQRCSSRCTWLPRASNSPLSIRTTSALHPSFPAPRRKYRRLRSCRSTGRRRHHFAYRRSNQIPPHPYSGRELRSSGVHGKSNEDGIIPVVAAALAGELTTEYRTNLRIDVFCEGDEGANGGPDAPMKGSQQFFGLKSGQATICSWRPGSRHRLRLHGCRRKSCRR